MSAGEIDDPTLFGYLLGGLDDAETDRIEVALRRSSVLRERLEYLRGQLAIGTPAEDVGFDPPAGLADRTLAAVRRSRPHAERQQIHDRLRPIGLSPPPEARLTVSNLNSLSYWFELSAVAGALLIFGVIGITHVLNLQEHARRQRCAMNLAALGLAIQDYAFHRQDQSTPSIDPDGPLAFAGVYAVRLNDSALLGSTGTLWCPSDPQSSTVGSWQCRELPSSQQLLEADEDQLVIWRRSSGGSYAYNLGIEVNDRYQSSRYRARAGFAILGDVPSIRGGVLQWLLHGDGVCNVLYEDGHVRFERRVGLSPLMDDPYLNENRLMQAGLHSEDAAMGPSPFGPKNNPKTLQL